MNLRKIRGKKAQEGGISPFTIGLVLLVVLLVLVMFAFTGNWFGLQDRWNQYTGGKSNIDSVRGGCSTACAQGELGRQSYSGDKRTVKLDGGFSVQKTCLELETFSGFCVVGKKIISIDNKGDCEAVKTWTAAVLATPATPATCKSGEKPLASITTEADCEVGKWKTQAIIIDTPCTTGAEII